jgi:hypothetical protein
MALVTADSNLVTADVIVVDASGYWPPDVVTVGAVTCTPELSTVEIPDVVTVGAVTCTPELSTVEIPEAAQTLPNAFSTGVVNHTIERGIAARQAGPGMVRHQ